MDKTVHQPTNGFDRWLGKQLRGVYDPVLDEPVPDELMRLIMRFEQRAADEPSAEPGKDE